MSEQSNNLPQSDSDDVPSDSDDAFSGDAVRPDASFGAALPELRELVKSQCDGTLTVEQRDRLEAILRADEGARRFYLVHMDMHARMQWSYRGHAGDSTESDRPGSHIDSDSDPSGGPGGTAGPESGKRKAWLPGILGSVFGTGSSSWFRPQAFLLLGVAVTLGLLAAGWGWHRSHQESVADNEAVENAAQPHYVAQLGRTVGARWTGPFPNPVDPRFIAGSELVLTKGLAEITFASGATVFLEGPATFQIQSGMEASLVSGKASAEVPKQATGFTIHTPKAKVIDLGTAFGVRVDPKGSTEIQVFKGKVNAAARDPLSHASRTYELTEGESLELGEGKHPVVALDTDPTAFPSLPPLTSADRYQQWQGFRDRLLRDPSLVGYWGFDDDNAADLSGHKNDGELVGVLKFSTSVPPLVGGGKCLDVSGGPAYVVIPHSASLVISDELTVAFWMRGDNRQQDWSRVISKAGPMNCSGWVIHRAGDANEIRAVVGNSVHCNQSIADMKGVYDGRWHHVTMTANRGKWRAYLDGELEAKGEYRHDEGLASIADLVIGAAGMDQDFGEYDFEGQLDEVAVFRRALSADEVRRMYSGGEGILPTTAVEASEASQEQMRRPF